jgi:hypothetical protein
VNFSSSPWHAGTAVSDAVLATQNFLEDATVLADRIGLSGPPVSNAIATATMLQAKL